MTPDEAAAHLVRTDPRFEVTEADIRGVRYRVFRNAPPHLRALLQHAGSVYNGGDLLVYRDERWDYIRFCSEVCRVANAMERDLGVRQGDRVAIAMRNFPELPILILAVSALGAVAVPMNAWWSEDELAYAIDDCDARVVFADGPRHARIAPFASRQGLQLFAVRDAEGDRNYAELRDGDASDHWPEAVIDPDDDFAVLYSSGSTGRPKGVVLTHRGAISTVYSWLLTRAMAPLVDGAVPPSGRPLSWMVATPLFHVTALHAVFLQGLVNGAKLSLLYKWDAEEAIRVIETEQVNRFVGVPTQSADLMETARRLGETLDSLEYIGAGGAKRPPAQVGQLAEAFPHAAVSTGWGMTETNSLGITLGGPEYVNNPGTAGRLTPPVQEMRIVDLDGKAVPPGEVGELLVKSPANMRCYLNQPEATAATLRDGWLHTGDLARLEENGLVTIVDRMKSIIIRGGENIACLDVEGALYQHPAVAEACVFPVPDERLGEIVGAAVQPKADTRLSEQELVDFLAERIARFKIPGRFWFRDQPLPRGATDKVDRRALRAECLTTGPRDQAGHGENRDTSEPEPAGGHLAGQHRSHC
ncbi:MAG: acyl--CoA ligase [Ectothiorhodospiraceae bacterium]|nr:acyl--CoA ligase [Ectothiorhodospiraceae bacterium]MCH8503829.1 acyl--CoA ligase [Ectothiorhodospiraceae bacterium]